MHWELRLVDDKGDSVIELQIPFSDNGGGGGWWFAQPVYVKEDEVTRKNMYLNGFTFTPIVNVAK